MDLRPYGEITSVVVFRGGEVVCEEYLEGDPDTLRNTRSCTKTVAGMLLGIAIERGIVPGVETPLADLIGEPAPPVTLRDLLTMSSCLECNDWDGDSPGNEELMYPREDWLAFALGLPLRAERTFSYCTAGVVALGIALERAIGEPLFAFARRELFEPLGIERAEWQQTPQDQTSTAGGLLLTSRELVRLGQVYLDGGRGLVPRAWVEESIRPHARIDDETEYGYLWWLRTYADEPGFYMTGKRTSAAAMPTTSATGSSSSRSSLPHHEDEDREQHQAARIARRQRPARDDERAQLRARRVSLGGELLREMTCMPCRPPTVAAERHRRDPEPERRLDPRRREPEALVLGERDPEAEREQRAEPHERGADRRQAQERVDLARPLTPHRRVLQHSHDCAAREEAERAEEMEEEQDVGERHDARTISRCRRPIAICGC